MKYIFFSIFLFTTNLLIADESAKTISQQPITQKIYEKEILPGKLTVNLICEQKRISFPTTEVSNDQSKCAQNQLERYCYVLDVIVEDTKGISSRIWTSPTCYRETKITLEDEKQQGPFAFVYDSKVGHNGSILLLYKLSGFLYLKEINIQDAKSSDKGYGIVLQEPMKDLVKYAINFPEKLIILSARIIATDKQIYVFMEQNGRNVLWDCSTTTPVICWQRETKVLRNVDWKKVIESH